MSDITPTRGAALALADEKRLIETGYGFLDEKRVLLASNLLRELREWQALRRDYEAENEQAATALRAAVLRHGIEGVQLYPAHPVTSAGLVVTETNYLGVKLLTAPALAWLAPPAPEAVAPSTEAEACRAAFAKLVPMAAQMALKQANIARLIKEYRATERRARALENVLLPETTAALRKINDTLDEADQEEAIRIHNAAR